MSLGAGSGRHWWGVAIAAWIAAMLAGGSGAVAATATRDEQQALYERSIKNPTDYETAFAYVKVSTELGDYEAAIGALERLLFYNPSLTRVKYELGSLYYRLESYEIAINYFQQALASPDLDAETRTRILAYLPAAQKERQQSRLWVFVQTGLRYQSNATFTPSSNLILSGGVLQPIDLSGPHGADWNWFGLAQVAHDLDFGNQRGDKLETRLSGYLTRQFRLTALDVGLVSGSIGPRLALAPNHMPGATVKPYVLGGAAWVGGMPYVTNTGAGVSLGLPIGKAISISPGVEWQKATYSFADPSTSILGPADWVTSSISADARFSETFSVTAKLSHRRASGANPWQSYTETSEEIGAKFRFDPPLPNIPHKWTLAPFARFVQIRFDAPNAAIDPVNARRDAAWQAGISLDAPLTAHFGLSVLAEYSNNGSNLPNYANDSWSVLFGPTGRF